MPVHLNAGQQLRVARAALFELVEEIQDISDLPQNDAALVFAIFAVYHRKKHTPDETDSDREDRIATTFKSLVEDHLSQARQSGALPPPPPPPPPSPNPEPPQGVVRSELDDIRRDMAEHFELSLEKQRVALAEENRIREIRARDYSRHPLKKFPTHPPPKKHTKRMNPWPICKKTESKKRNQKKQNQKNALKLFLQSRRPLLVMHSHRPLLAMWFRRVECHFVPSWGSFIQFEYFNKFVQTVKITVIVLFNDVVNFAPKFTLNYLHFAFFAY